MSRQFLLPLLASVVVLQSSCSHKLAPEGNYQSSPVVADGRLNDWKLPLRFTNADYTVNYAVTNDDKNLYICVVSKDPVTVQRILKAGMNIYLDPKGAKNKEISIAFPIRKAADPVRYRSRYGDPGNGNGYGNGYGNGGNPNSTDSVGAGAYGQGSSSGGSASQGQQGAPMDGASSIANSSAITRRANLEKLLGESDTYNTTGFINMQNGQYGLTDTKSPILISMGLTNENGIAYEAIIPLRNLSYDRMVSKNETRNFSVGIVLNASAGGAGGRPGGGQGGGGGFRPSVGLGMGGGMGMGMGMGMMRMGGGGGRRNGANNAAGKEDDNWYTFSLAKPQPATK
ncbi:MAG: hypothetical protein P4L51_23190 [Puia sp.]|nr:hypothetical protein [Puia sp.]